MTRAIVLLALGLSACADSGRAQPVWTEEATSIARDGSRPWANPLGDWVDAAGVPLGAKPFASAEFGRTKGVARAIKLDVTDLVRRHGADFRLNAVSSIVSLASRESPNGDGPVLEVSGSSGTRRLTAAADTELKPRARCFGEKPTLDTRYGALVRFDQRADPAIRSATLIVTALRVYGQRARLNVYRPVVLSAPATPAPGALFAASRPTEVKRSRQVEELRPGLTQSAHRGPGRTLVAVRGADLNPVPTSSVRGDTFVTAFDRIEQTAAKDVIPIPGAPVSAYMTVVMKLSPGFVAPAGKLPGLSNTGMKSRGDPCIVDGQPVQPGGWGGRRPNGCRWSARTQWQTLADGRIQAGSYAYAVRPKTNYGVVDPWSLPVPKGRWFAYVQWVKLNQPGADDGEIAYWLVDRATAPGGRQVQAASGFVWRTIDAPQSGINELWVNLFCGGRDCGPRPWPRSEMQVKRLAVTTGLPDLTALQGELDRLNAGS